MNRPAATEAGGEFYRASGWVGFAIGAFFFFGLTNFSLGIIVEKSADRAAASISAPFLVWFGMGLLGVAALAVFRRSGGCLAGIPGPLEAAIAATSGVTLAAGMLTLKLGFAADTGARGPIVAITATNSALVALLAWLLLKERLTWRQIAGLAIIIGGVVLLAPSSSTHASYRSFLYGLASMGLFGITNFLLKYCSHRGADSLHASALLWLSGGACGLIALGIAFATGRGLTGLEPLVLKATALAAGLFLGAGMLMLKLAVARGPAGPAAAVAGSNAVLVVLLEWGAFGHLPAPSRLVGMAIALAGIFVLALSGRRRA